jgi:hypothetical protein
VTDLRYPIGPFQAPQTYDAHSRTRCIADIEAAPRALREAVRGLSAKQLDTPYRPGGWTVRQVVHHVPDSHMNAYVRLKLAITEDEPTIKPYEEARWAELIDGHTGAPDVSLALLEALHIRWVMLWRSLTAPQFSRRFRHPDHKDVLTVDWMLAMYAWHGRHHVAHITALREREGWR